MNNSSKSSRYRLAFVVLTCLFFMWGFFTVLNDILIPPLQGRIADIWGVHLSFIIPVFSYIYLAYYGWRGFKVTKFKKFIENKI